MSPSTALLISGSMFIVLSALSMVFGQASKGLELLTIASIFLAANGIAVSIEALAKNKCDCINLNKNKDTP